MGKPATAPSVRKLTTTILPVSADATTDQDIDGLLSGVAWDLKSIGSVTYSFPDSANDYGTSISGFRQFNADQRDAVRTILGTNAGSDFGSVSSIATISFSELSGTGDKAALVRYGSRKTSDAYASYPSEKADGGDAWFTTSGYYDRPSVGTGGYTGIMHETGHALGLKHSFDNSGSGPVPAIHDSLEYSVMSYSSFVGAKSWYGADGDYPQTLMMDDIAALQYMYGVNFTTHSGDTAYTWSPLTGSLQISDWNRGATTTETFDAPNTSKIFMTVWDGGGTDTYDFSSFSGGLNVDLRPGRWIETKDHSQTADLGATDSDLVPNYASGIIANALSVRGTDGSGTPYAAKSLIENAIGGAGDDFFVANEALNQFTGGPGADVFSWASLADAQNMLGGGGKDLVTDFSGQDRIDLRALHLSNVEYVAQETGYDIVGYVGTAREFAIHIEGSFDVAVNWSSSQDWLLI